MPSIHEERECEHCGGALEFVDEKVDWASGTTLHYFCPSCETEFVFDEEN